MFAKYRFILLLFGLTALLDPMRSSAQAPSGVGSSLPVQQPSAKQQQDRIEDIVRINTRVVFIDTLERDKKTGVPVTDLKLESFQVLDDGKPRKLSYFSREGVGHRPLALTLVLDLSTSSILYLEKPEVMDHIIVALSKLRPEDEIAVVQRWYEPQSAPQSFQLRSRIVEDFTVDRAKTFGSLRRVQQFAKENLPKVKMFFSFKDAISGSWKAGVAGASGVPTGTPNNTTVAHDHENVVDRAPALARERPHSQFVILEVTDDFGTEAHGKVRKIVKELIGSGVTVSGMVVKRNLMDKVINFAGVIVSPLMGTRFHTISHYGKQTGGEVATVGRPEEFGRAIERIIGGLAARYTLGFTLEEAERNDDRVHQLEVKVKSRSNRKLSVSARRSYIPKLIDSMR